MNDQANSLQEAHQATCLEGRSMAWQLKSETYETRENLSMKYGSPIKWWQFKSHVVELAETQWWKRAETRWKHQRLVDQDHLEERSLVESSLVQPIMRSLGDIVSDGFRVWYFYQQQHSFSGWMRMVYLLALWRST